MINFGGKKEEGDKNEAISQAMRSMSDQIGRQAQEIKRLQEELSWRNKMPLPPKRRARRWPPPRRAWPRWKLS